MAGFLSDSTREQIRAASDIVEIIGGYIPLKRAGASFTALCPFHREKTPSFHVNPHRQIFHCFGCHKGGDVFKFVQEYESLSFIEAVRRLAERARIPLEFDSSPGQQEARHLKDTLLQIHDQLATRWQAALANDASGQIARDYLAKRGVSEEAVKLFRIGYAPEAWDDTVNWGRAKGYPAAVLEQAGLIVARDGGGHYDRFRGRLMFPICDEQGRVIAFSGRVLSGDEKTAKYVNSPETPIFTKGKVFFGLDKSKRAILDEKFAIICEGQLDLIACYMSGTKNMVAPQGTAFTPDHARILKRYTNEVVLCFDSDEAGQKAATRVYDLLLAAGLAIRVAVVPAPHDPDSYIKSAGGDAFQKLVRGAAGFFDYYLDRLCATNNLSSDQGRVTVLREMGIAVRKTGNLVLLDKYAQKTAVRLGVSADSVREEFKKVHVTPPGHEESEPPFIPPDDAQEQPQPRTPPSDLDLWFLRLLVARDDSIQWFAQRLDPNWIQHEAVRRIYSLRLAVHNSGNWAGLAGFVGEIEEPELRELITAAAATDRELPELERQWTQVVLRLNLLYVNNQLAELERRHHADPGSEQVMMEQTQLRHVRTLLKRDLDKEMRNYGSFSGP